MIIAAGAFKAKCLSLMEEVRATRSSVTITKRGKPFAVLVPYADRVATPVFGRLKGQCVMTDDLTAPADEAWEADR